MTRTRVAASCLLVILAAGCQAPTIRPAEGLPAVTQSRRVIEGRIADPEERASRQVAAQVSDIANGATLTLLDAASGRAIATTVANASGAFSLNLGAFTPVAGLPYILEATKRLDLGGPDPIAVSPAARLRTLLCFRDADWRSGTWTSLSSAIPGDIVALDKGTTALCAIVGLRGLSTVDQQRLVGSLDGATYDDGDRAIGQAEFARVAYLVGSAIAADQDPIELIGYDPSGTTAASRFGIRPGHVVMQGATGPLVATAGSTFTVSGQNLPRPGEGGAVMAIGNQPVAFSTNGARTRITVSVPAAAYSGQLQLTLGSRSWYGAFVGVRGTVGTLAGNGTPSWLDGIGTGAALNGFLGVAVDGSGTVYVGDRNNYRIRTITPLGVVGTLAGSGTPGLADGAGGSARFGLPEGLAIFNGNVYVADRQNCRIRMINPAGVVTTYAGTSCGYVDGAALTTAKLGSVDAVAVDATGNLYIADESNNAVRKVTTGGSVTTLAGAATAGYVNATGAAARFNTPAGIGVDAAGNVYVADYFNYRIRKITPAGAVSTLAGSGTAGYANGTGAAAQFNGAARIAVDAAGNVYVADGSNYRIRKVTPAGVVTTLAGSGTNAWLDGPALSAQFAWPDGIAVDAAGNLFVADRGGHRLRVYTP